jgi:hypothetical protein
LEQLIQEAAMNGCVFQRDLCNVGLAHPLPQASEAESTLKVADNREEGRPIISRTEPAVDGVVNMGALAIVGGQLD